MPTIWRFLAFEFSKVMNLCLVAFLIILVSTRLDEIAAFSTLGATAPYIWRFLLYQIPYVLPIALPISALIAASLLMQRLSATHELTALRACGYSLSSICTPILLVSCILAIFNFWVVSEAATYSHLMKRVLKREIKSLNPLVLLQNGRLPRLKNLYIQMAAKEQGQENVHNLVVARYNRRWDNTDLLMIHELSSKAEELSATDMTLISTPAKSEVSEGPFLPLYIENASHVLLPTHGVAQLLRGGGSWTPKDDHLSLSLLLQRIHRLRSTIQDPKAKLSNSEKQRHEQKIQSGYSELARRTALTLAVPTFTLMGLAFGIHLSPRALRHQIARIVFMAALSLVAFFSAKHLHQIFPVALTLYLAPQLLLFGLSCHMLYTINQGRTA